MKTALLCLMLLTGCASVPDDTAAKCEAGGGCVTLSKAVEAIQKAWNHGWSHGYDKGTDDAPPSCRRPI